MSLFFPQVNQPRFCVGTSTLLRRLMVMKNVWFLRDIRPGTPNDEIQKTARSRKLKIMTDENDTNTKVN